MKKHYTEEIPATARIEKLKSNLLAARPQIETERAQILTESYKATEDLPIAERRGKAFAKICREIPITIREHELIVGSTTKQSRSCQVFPEYSFEWLEDEFDTVATRSADPFYISEESKAILHDVYKYWKGKTTSDLAKSYMSDEALTAIEHNIFTVGNYFYNGIGHVNVDYALVLEIGFGGIIKKTKDQIAKLKFCDPQYATKKSFLNSVVESLEGAIDYAKRYAALAEQSAITCSDPVRKAELLKIAENCKNVPENGANSFYEACQSFWFVQMLLQTESSGHSISPGRFDQYMYPYYIKDIESGAITREFAQELIDCLWIKLNDMNKVRDKASAEGFAGYSLFQNLVCGGQTSEGLDATNDLSFMCVSASMHIMLPQPSLSVRVWNGTPHSLLIKCAKLTRTGVGLPAYYNDEVIIPALVNRGLTMEDARDYCIIGCVEPQKGGKTDGWHDSAFFNMCRPLELVFSNGYDNGKLISIQTGDVADMKTYEEFYDAYKKQMEYMIALLVNADNAVDCAHARRCPLPFESSMVEDCIGRGKSIQEGGAIYNFTGPQGFGVANMADSLYAIKKLVFEQKRFTLVDLKEALAHNFGKDSGIDRAKELTVAVVKSLAEKGIDVTESEIAQIFKQVRSEMSDSGNSKYAAIKDMIDELPKFGNDDDEVDALARDVAYCYTKPVERHTNPRGGKFQAGLYPVSANVPLGAQTGATPDGRYAYTPVADGVSPSAGKDVNGPTAGANSVSKLDHLIASNGTLYNMKFHPSALEGTTGLESFVALVRAYFDRKGSHVQFNVVSRETLRDAQAHPENYQGLCVRVAGYSALFVTLSKSLQDDIINRTEQKGF